MYLNRAFRRALSETKAFWSVHRNWAYFSVPASGVLLRFLRKGLVTVTDAKEIVLFLLFGYVFSWIGSFLINLFRAPALLDADRRLEIADLKLQRSKEMKQGGDVLAQEQQLRIQRELELQRQIGGL